MESTSNIGTNRPSVILVSEWESRCREFADAMEGTCRLTLATELGSLYGLFRQQRPDAIVVDQLYVSDGGHSVARAFESLPEEMAGTPVVILVSPQCPEPLERLATQEHIELIHGESIDPLIDLMKDRFQSQGIPVSSSSTLEEASTAGTAVFEGITRQFETRSPELKQMLDDLMIAASHDVTILLIGETGSGKTFLSSLIHEASPRKQQPFLHVACGALPRELIESELFGHSKGSFTSAHADKEGKFVVAKSGTVLLDEIDVLGPEQQVKLLRVIETGEFEPVGSNNTQRLQARLVVASNLDLQPLVENGRFRPDLYYRLNMLKFEIPPLRKRKIDVIPLAKRFIAKFQEKHGKTVHRIEDSVLDALLSYPWPGNVRELEHVIQRMVIYCRDGVLTTAQLPPNILGGRVGPTNDPSVVLGSNAPRTEQSLEKQVALNEKEIIEQALFKNNFSRTKTARDLGISRVTLYNKMKKYDMLK